DLVVLRVGDREVRRVPQRLLHREVVGVRVVVRHAPAGVRGRGDRVAGTLRAARGQADEQGYRKGQDERLTRGTHRSSPGGDVPGAPRHRTRDEGTVIPRREMILESVNRT